MKSMQNMFCRRTFSGFATLFVAGLLIFSVQPAIAQTADSELLQRLMPSQVTTDVSESPLENGNEYPREEVIKGPRGSLPSRAEKFFSVPAPEMGATFRGSSFIDESTPTKGSVAGEELIVSDVNRDLQQFGYEFFANPKGSFLPDKMAPVGPDYMVGPGDRLLVSIWGSIEGNHETIVGRNGEIVLPKIGSISVWGQNFAEAKETIRKHVAKYFTGFDLSVTMAGVRSIQVFLVGEVAAPGTYTVSALSTVLTALIEAGGPAKTGSLRKIQLRRAGKLVDTVDFYDFLLNGDTSHDRTLQAGDTIVVPIIGPLVGVAGDVRRPAIYELNQGETLQAALALAGGLNTTAFVGKVQIERIDSHTRRVVLDVDLDKGDTLAMPIQDQDLVKVPSISPLTASYVRLTGYVARPGQYQLSPGMRVADLILPYENLLPMYYPKMAEILRLDPPEYRPSKLTIDLSLALAGSPDNNIELQEFDELRIFSRDDMEEIPEVHISGAVQRPGVYRLFEGMTVRDLIVASGNLTQDAYLADAELTQYFEMGKETRTERLTLELGKAMQGDTAHNLQLQPGDHLMVRAIPDFQKKYRVKVEGKVLFPGTYTIAKGEHLSSVLERAGGFSEGAYLRGAVFTRKSVEELVRERMQKLIAQEEESIINLSNELAQGAFDEADAIAAQNLLENRKQIVSKMKSAPAMGRMVIHLTPLETLRDRDYDIELMDGDTVFIPEVPYSVTVLGEVYNPTTIAYKPGSTASFYLSMVGGVNKNADEDEMFIVRADGSVYSKKQGGGSFGWDDAHNRWISGGFASIELYPGDTILVPQDYDTTDWMRETKDVSLIMFQLALAAAAVASF